MAENDIKTETPEKKKKKKGVHPLLKALIIVIVIIAIIVATLYITVWLLDEFDTVSDLISYIGEQVK